jgi:hypothetical protein
MRGEVCCRPDGRDNAALAPNERGDTDEQSRHAVRRGNIENGSIRRTQIMVLPSAGCRAADGDRAHGRTGTGRSDAALLHPARFGFPFFTTLGIFDVPGLRQPDGSVPGLHHFQMRFATISDLFDRYEALASHGIVPARSANHGPGTSFYYRDPDNNQLELSASNYLSEPEVVAFFKSEAFRRNPAGIDVDPAEYVRRYRDGVSLEKLRLIPEPV